MTYSKERRAEVLAECDAGKGTREVALFSRSANRGSGGSSKSVVNGARLRRLRHVVAGAIGNRTPIGCGRRPPRSPTPR
jgi:hypothetical protein